MVNRVLSGPSVASLTDWPQLIPALGGILGGKEAVIKVQ